MALDLTTDDEKENKQIADLNALKGYRHSVVSIPRNITFSHRGSIGKCMYIILIICLKEIGSAELIFEVREIVLLGSTMKDIFHSPTDYQLI